MRIFITSVFQDFVFKGLTAGAGVITWIDNAKRRGKRSVQSHGLFSPFEVRFIVLADKPLIVKFLRAQTKSLHRLGVVLRENRVVELVMQVSSRVLLAFGSFERVSIGLL